DRPERRRREVVAEDRRVVVAVTREAVGAVLAHADPVAEAGARDVEGRLGRRRTGPRNGEANDGRKEGSMSANARHKATQGSSMAVRRRQVSPSHRRRTWAKSCQE